MSSLQARSPSRAAAAPIVDTSARLELLEYFLVHSDDVALCAQASLEWLADNAGVKRCMCLAVDAEASALVGIAGLGVPQEDVELFSWSLDRHDPLLLALSATEPTEFRATRGNGTHSAISMTPLGAGPISAIPLRGTSNIDDSAVGLLL